MYSFCTTFLLNLIFFFIAIWFHLSYYFYCNIQFHFLVFNSSLFMSLENSNQLVKNLTNHLGNTIIPDFLYVPEYWSQLPHLSCKLSYLWHSLPIWRYLLYSLNQGFGSEKDGNHGKFIISNLVIKNLKDLHCAYLLANQKPDLLFILSQLKADM